MEYLVHTQIPVANVVCDHTANLTARPGPLWSITTTTTNSTGATAAGAVTKCILMTCSVSLKISLRHDDNFLSFIVAEDLGPQGD